MQGSSAEEGTCTGPSEVCQRTREEAWEKVMWSDETKIELFALVCECVCFAVFGGREMLSTTPRTPSPLWSMEVETLCFGGVSQLRGQDTFTVSRGGWMGPCTGKFGAKTSQWKHWKWVMDGSSNMTMTQNIWPRQQRSGSKRSKLIKPCVMFGSVGPVFNV